MATRPRGKKLYETDRPRVNILPTRCQFDQVEDLQHDKAIELDQKLLLPESIVTGVLGQLGVQMPSTCIEKIRYRVSHMVRKAVIDAQHQANLAGRSCLAPSDIARALQFFNYDTVASNDPNQYDRISNTAFGIDNLFAFKDQIITVDQMLSDVKDLKIPPDIDIQAHYVLINNQIPKTAENINVVEADDTQQPGTSTEKSLTPLPDCLRPTSNQFMGITGIRRLAVHPISFEKQQFFKIITEKITDQQEMATSDSEILRCIESDAAILPIVPHLVSWFQAGVHCNLALINMAILIYLIRFIIALSKNPYIKLKPYLPIIVPSMMSIIYADHLSARKDEESHWNVRDWTVKAFVNIAKLDAKILAQALNFARDVYRLPSVSRAAQIGSAITFMAEVSQELIPSVLIPGARRCAARIENELRTNKSGEAEEKACRHLFRVLVAQIAGYLAHNDLPDLQSHSDFKEKFGASLGEGIYAEIDRIRSTETTNIQTRKIAVQRVNVQQQKPGINVRSFLPPANQNSPGQSGMRAQYIAR